MSPILVRPVREQLEHDRVIRQLQARLKRRHDVAINTGEEQTAGVKIGPGQMYPDLVLTSTDRNHRLEGIVEVETSESVNHLEAMAQWAHFGRARAPFHLYVPAAAIEIARRLCVDNQVSVAEIWSYHAIGDQTRFTLVQRAPAANRTAARSEARKRTAAPPRRNGGLSRRIGSAKAEAAKGGRKKAAKPAGKTSRTQKRK